MGNVLRITDWNVWHLLGLSIPSSTLSSLSMSGVWQKCEILVLLPPWV
jgi:hypothetical protein